MIYLANYIFVAIVQRPDSDSSQTYFVDVPQDEPNHHELKRLMFGFHQGIDDNYNAKKPSFISSLGYTRNYQIGGVEKVRIDYYAVPNEALDEFTRAIEAYKLASVDSSFYYWYSSYRWVCESFSAIGSELFTDEFYALLTRKGGL